ncbi:hypothetical protein Mapa_011607 [Marchantia paleacea]|nr:hypothetical protein Mapa_011607 [Marchantia paleacea]
MDSATNEREREREREKDRRIILKLRASGTRSVGVCRVDKMNSLPTRMTHARQDMKRVGEPQNSFARPVTRLARDIFRCGQCSGFMSISEWGIQSSAFAVSWIAL